MNLRSLSMPSVIAENRSPVPAAAQFRLAVIITCWNYAEFVERSINSVLSQNIPQCELIVIDDGSSDDSWNVITNKEVRAYKIENSGQRRACAFALSKTTAPFILFLDADDELCPGSIATLISALDSSVAKIQYPLAKIDAAGNRMGEVFPKLGDWREREKIQELILRRGVYASPPTSGNVFRRDLCKIIEAADYDASVDGVILFAAPFLGDILSFSKPLGLYRSHGKNDSKLYSPIDQAKIERSLERYISRINHLNSFLLSRGSDRIVDPDTSFFVLQQRIFLNVVRGKRCAWREIIAVIRTAFAYDQSKNKSVVLSLFFILLFMLPRRGSKKLLEYRFR